MPRSNMREICWRARRLTDNQWVYGQYMEFHNAGMIYENPNTGYDVNITTKGMFINILDKNGKKVFEGDLLIMRDENNHPDIYVVVHRGCGFVGKSYEKEEYINLVTHEIEVVGIYYSSDLEQQLLSIKGKLDHMLEKTLKKE